jgi:hypothetical protein
MKIEAAGRSIGGLFSFGAGDSANAALRHGTAGVQ